jgi:hypothetical protein
VASSPKALAPQAVAALEARVAELEAANEMLGQLNDDFNERYHIRCHTIVFLQAPLEGEVVGGTDNAIKRLIVSKR